MIAKVLVYGDAVRVRPSLPKLELLARPQENLAITIRESLMILLTHPPSLVSNDRPKAIQYKGACPCYAETLSLKKEVCEFVSTRDARTLVLYHFFQKI